jgi:monoamine oxidase
MRLISPDQSLEKAVLDSIAEVGMEGRPSLTDWQIAYLEDDYAEELHRLSLRVARLDEDFHGGDFALPGGFAPLVESIARGADVRLDHRVTAIEHGVDPVRVTTVRGTFTARCALVTLPIGVLRPSVGARGATVLFSPELPPRKVKAAARLGVGLMNKVILRFPRAFWTMRRDVIGWTGRRHGEFPLFVNGQRIRGAPLLEALIVGDNARALEPESDEHTVRRTMDALRVLYGPGIPAPDAVRVTRWGQDPYSLGAYSYAEVGATGADRRALAEPVGARLYFAGEATHPTLSGTVHGAYLTGLAEAQRIAATLAHPAY